MFDYCVFVTSVFFNLNYQSFLRTTLVLLEKELENFKERRTWLEESFNDDINYFERINPDYAESSIERLNALQDIQEIFKYAHLQSSTSQGLIESKKIDAEIKKYEEEKNQHIEKFVKDLNSAEKRIQNSEENLKKIDSVISEIQTEINWIKNRIVKSPQ